MREKSMICQLYVFLFRFLPWYQGIVQVMLKVSIIDLRSQQLVYDLNNWLHSKKSQTNQLGFTYKSIIGILIE